MAFNAVVRRAIADRAYPRRRAVKPGTVKISTVVRFTIEPSRIRAFNDPSGLGRKMWQLNLTDAEFRRVDPVRTTLFGNRDLGRFVKLIINRRRAYLLSVNDSGHIVFTWKRFE